MEFPGSRPRVLTLLKLLVLLLVLSFQDLPVRAAIGINYGQIADNLPPPEQVVGLVQRLGVTKLKLFDANPKILQAFANTSIEFVVMVRNEDIVNVQQQDIALNWVKSNVVPHLPATKITGIAVGNEILTANDAALSGALEPAMQSVHGALAQLGLDDQIFVTTPHSFGIMGSSFPPSSGSFQEIYQDYLRRILNYHAETGSPFWLNVYPFFAYKDNPQDIPLEYALFQPNKGVDDPATGLHYDNLLFAQVDAVSAAIASLGFGKQVTVQVSETGWPSHGDPDEIGASPENAAAYNGNLMKVVSNGSGTPMKPGSEIMAYIFSLFNEDQKPGPTSERNFGLYNADGTPAYPVGPPVSEASTRPLSSTQSSNVDCSTSLCTLF